MAAFAQLLEELIQIASPIDVIGCAARVVRDETRHVELCARVVTELGGSAPTAGSPRWVVSDERRPARDRVAYTMVGSMCIAESISVTMIARALKRTSDPVLYEVTRRVLADEAFHSRFGFDWLVATWRTLPLSTRLYVESTLPRRLAAIEREQAPDRRSLFLHTMTSNVLPRLEAAGVRAHRAWKARST